MSLLKILRDECNNMHEELHTHPLLKPLSGNISLQNYKDIIEAFYIAYTASEKSLALTVERSIPNASVMKWLQEDVSHHQLKISVMPVKFPAINNISKLVGYLYIKQGSTLGGQVISKHLSRKIGLKPGIDNYFFYGYGSLTGQKWKEFVNYIESVETKINIDEVVQTAKFGFQNISNCCDMILKRNA